MSLLSNEIKTPFGLLSVVVDDADLSVVLSGFLPLTQLLNEKINNQKPIKDKELLGVVDAVNNWIDGDIAALTKVSTRQPGSDFAQSCYEAMKNIKPGHTLSYQQLASKSLNPSAIRAAASTCAKNQNAPFVPCHRIITSKGEIGNYAYGSSLKLAILRHEGWKTPSKIPVQ
jgi:methylated-DNA-[protein]-cysteine S-methyltransferase